MVNSEWWFHKREGKGRAGFGFVEEALPLSANEAHRT
jgi:hypothetical protein